VVGHAFSLRPQDADAQPGEPIADADRHFRTLADAVPHLVWVGDSDGNPIYLNAVARGYLGPSALSGGLPAVDLIHPEDREAVQRKSLAAIQSGGVFECEARVRSWDGSFCWFLIRAAHAHDADGRSVRWFGTATDIQPLKRAQQEREALLAEANRRAAELDAALTAAPDGFVVYSSDGRVAWINAAGRRILGYSVEDTEPSLDERFARLRPRSVEGEPLTAEQSPSHRALAGERVSGFDFLVEVDGHAVRLSGSAFPVIMPDGRTVGAVTTFRDVTATRRAEADLQERERRFRRLVEVSSQMVWVMNTRGEPTEDSASWRAFTGRTKDEWSGRGWLQAIHPEDRERVASSLSRALETNDVFEVDFRLQHVSGQYRDVIARAAPVLNPDGTAREWVAMTTDVTDRRRAERAVHRYELLAANTRDVIFFVRVADGRILEANTAAESAYGYRRDELRRLTVYDLRPDSTRDAVRLQLATADRDGITFETLHLRRDGTLFPVEVSARGVTVDGERLVISVVRDITERREAERRKDDFIAVLSHELRNPLAPIRTALHVLDHAPSGSAKARRAREIADRQLQHLSRLVDDLLDVTRIARGKIRLVRDCVDLRELVSRCVEDHRALLEQHHLKHRLSVPVGPVHVDGDASRLSQVVGNLLLNASKFTASGGSVTVSLTRDEGEAVISVVDTGIGIAPEMLERLFEPFAQAETTLERARGGLGLGLALVRGLVNLHGGTVSARSEGANRGATFEIRLPLAEPAASQPVEVVVRRGERRRILVIEDHRDAADSLRDALEMAGHDVSVAYDGPSGLAAAHALRPEVILCDLGLPGLSGFDVARTIRRDAMLRPVLLVALTGYGSPQDAERARQSGFDQHIRKPADVDEIARLIESVTA
jgi:PAS domain S-box-containing protein